VTTGAFLSSSQPTRDLSHITYWLWRIRDAVATRHTPIGNQTTTSSAASRHRIHSGGFVCADREGFSVFQLLFVRSIVVAVIVVALFSAGRRSLRFTTTRPLEHCLRIIANICAFGLFFTAIRIAQLADIVAVMMTAPLMIALLSGPLLGERTGIYEWIGVLIGFGGVLIMTVSGDTGLSVTATLLGLTASLCYAMFVILTRRMSDTESSETLLLYSASGTAIFCLPLMFLLWITPSPVFFLAMLVLGLISTLGHWLLVNGYSCAPAYVVAPFDYTALVWAVLLGLIFWSEYPAREIIIGSVLIVLAGFIIIYRSYLRYKMQ